MKTQIWAGEVVVGAVAVTFPACALISVPHISPIVHLDSATTAIYQFCNI